MGRCRSSTRTVLPMARLMGLCQVSIQTHGSHNGMHNYHHQSLHTLEPLGTTSKGCNMHMGTDRDTADNHHRIYLTSHTNPTPEQHSMMCPTHTTHLIINRSTSLCLRPLGTPRLRLTNRNSSPDHKAMGTSRLHPTNSSNSLYHKVLGYSRLQINPTSSLNHTITGLNRLLPPA
jgi:hypothetical protein